MAPSHPLQPNDSKQTNDRNFPRNNTKRNALTNQTQMPAGSSGQTVKPSGGRKSARAKDPMTHRLRCNCPRGKLNQLDGANELRRKLNRYISEAYHGGINQLLIR